MLTLDRNVCKKNLPGFMPTIVMGGVCVVLKPRIKFYLNEAKWDEIRKLKSKGDNEHGT